MTLCVSFRFRWRVLYHDTALGVNWDFPRRAFAISTASASALRETGVCFVWPTHLFTIIFISTHSPNIRQTSCPYPVSSGGSRNMQLTRFFTCHLLSLELTLLACSTRRSTLGLMPSRCFAVRFLPAFLLRSIISMNRRVSA